MLEKWPLSKAAICRLKCRLRLLWPFARLFLFGRKGSLPTRVASEVMKSYGTGLATMEVGCFIFQAPTSSSWHCQGKNGFELPGSRISHNRDTALQSLGARCQHVNTSGFRRVDYCGTSPGLRPVWTSGPYSGNGIAAWIRGDRAVTFQILCWSSTKIVSFDCDGL